MVVGFECRPNEFVLSPKENCKRIWQKNKTTAPQKRRQGRVLVQDIWRQREKGNVFDSVAERIGCFSDTQRIYGRSKLYGRMVLFRRTITNEIRAKCARVTVFPVTAVAPRIQPSQFTPAHANTGVSRLKSFGPSSPHTRPLLTRFRGLGDGCGGARRRRQECVSV